MKFMAGLLLAFAVFVAAAGAATEGSAIYAKSCKGCHGENGAKVGMGMTKPLQGMAVDDIRTALVGYKAGSYGGEKKSLMERVVKPLSDEEIESLAQYSGSL